MELSLSFPNDSPKRSKSMTFNKKYDIDTSFLKQIGNYKIGAEIGAGAFGKVVLGKHTLTNETVAIKILDKMMLNQTPEDYELVRQEISILKIVKHKYIVQLYEILQTPQHIFLIMEYCEGKDLMDYILAKNRLSEFESLKFFQQLINALFYLHSQNISHRDVKIDNMLLDRNRDLKLVDFGLSTKYSDDTLLDQPCGTVVYAAPEVLEGNEYHGMLADVWSSGIVLFGMCSGYLPFCDNDDEVNKKHVIEGKIELPEFFSPMLKDLLKHMLDVNPLKRYTLQDIREHAWFNMYETNLIPGIIIGYNMIPVDENILNLCVAYGANRDEVEYSVRNNKYNEGSALYYLLVRKIAKKGFESISDLNSDAFIDFILDDYNLINKNKNISGDNIFRSHSMVSSHTNNDSERHIEGTSSMSSNYNNKESIAQSNRDLGAPPGFLENVNLTAAKRKKEIRYVKKINKNLISKKNNKKSVDKKTNNKLHINNASSKKNKNNMYQSMKKIHEKKNSEIKNSSNYGKISSNVNTPSNKDKNNKNRHIRRDRKNLFINNRNFKNNKLQKKRLNNSAEYRRTNNTTKVTNVTTKEPKITIKKSLKEKEKNPIIEQIEEPEQINITTKIITKENSTNVNNGLILNKDKIENIEKKESNNPISNTNDKKKDKEDIKLINEITPIKDNLVPVKENSEQKTEPPPSNIDIIHELPKTKSKEVKIEKKEGEKGNTSREKSEKKTISKEKLNNKLNTINNTTNNSKIPLIKKVLNTSALKHKNKTINTKIFHQKKIKHISKSIEYNYKTSNSLCDISLIELNKKNPIINNLLNSYEANNQNKKKHKKVISCIKYNNYSSEDCIQEEIPKKKNYKKILNETNYGKKITDNAIHIKSVSQPNLEFIKNTKNNSMMYSGTNILKDYNNIDSSVNINFSKIIKKKYSPKKIVEISNRLYTANNKFLNAKKNRANTSINCDLNTSRRIISNNSVHKNLAKKTHIVTSINNLHTNLENIDETNRHSTKNTKRKLYERNKTYLDGSVSSPHNPLNMSMNITNNHHLFKYGPSSSVPDKNLQKKHNKNKIRLNLINFRNETNKRNKSNLNNSMTIGKTDSKKLTEFKKYDNFSKKNIHRRPKYLESSVVTYRRKNTSNVIRDLSFSPKQLYLNEKTRKSRIPWKIQKKGIDEKLTSETIYNNYMNRFSNIPKKMKKYKPMNIRNRTLKTVKYDEIKKKRNLNQTTTEYNEFNKSIYNKNKKTDEKKILTDRENNDKKIQSHKAKCFSNEGLPGKSKNLKINGNDNTVKSLHELGIKNIINYNFSNTNKNKNDNFGLSGSSYLSISSISSRKILKDNNVFDLACVMEGKNINECCLNIVNKFKKHGCSIFYMKSNKIKVSKNGNFCEIEVMKLNENEDGENEGNKNLFLYKVYNKKIMSGNIGNKNMFSKFLLGA